MAQKIVRSRSKTGKAGRPVTDQRGHRRLPSLGQRSICCKCYRSMRLSILGPRSLLRLVILVSLPSLCMFIYLLTQVLPSAPGAIPIVLTIPDEHNAGKYRSHPFGIPRNNSAFSGLLDIDYFFGELESKQSLIDLTSSDTHATSNKTMSDGQPWDHDAAIYDAPTPVDTQGIYIKELRTLINQLPTGFRDAQGKPSAEELESYLLENYRTNKAKGFSDFSLRVTEQMIEDGPLQLPELIPNLNVPCWVEEVPLDFTYKNNIYHCHINSRRIKASFDLMFMFYQLRQKYSGFKWRVRCLPSFYIIGVAKCGTTDLFEALTRHPEILKPELKEPEYWPYLRFGINDLILNMTCAKDKGRASFADYMDTYDLTSELVKESIVRENGNLSANVHFGDYSTHTFIDIFDWDNTLDAPDKINAHHIHNVWPKSKFILILRDPIDRSYSRYKMRMARQDGGVKGTPEDFHKRVLKQVQTTNECLDQHSRRYCVYKAKYGVGAMGTNALLNTGIYVIYMNDWLSIFPRDQILILKFEDYIQDRTTTIENITNFLKMNQLEGAYRDIIESMNVMNAGPEMGGVLSHTREALQDFYRPYNNELVQLLGDDRFTWGY